MPKNKIVQAATMKLEVELRCSECNSPLIVNNTWSDVHGLSCYVEPCEECMSRRTKRAIDGATVSPIERDWSGEEEDKAWAHLQKPPRN